MVGVCQTPACHRIKGEHFAGWKLFGKEFLGITLGVFKNLRIIGGHLMGASRDNLGFPRL